ncbi:hypothetical protein Tco_1154278 [Tanacetum coccineum]
MLPLMESLHRLPPQPRPPPETSGQVEVSIYVRLKRILEKDSGCENRASGQGQLDALFGPSLQRTKHPSGALPVQALIYGKALSSAIVLKHISLLAHSKMQTFDLITAVITQRRKIKNRVFNVGDQVLLFNSRLKIFSDKLKSHWSGPFTIVQVFPYGTVELSQNSGPNFKVNGHRLKHYFGGDIPAMDIPDL